MCRQQTIGAKNLNKTLLNVKELLFYNFFHLFNVGLFLLKN